ncbi:nucleolar MIF4G domain-containing protein 1 [Vanessa atalanta]|uniref:nucleolar MIF4G domain-containing protein 1 n=1 Tax=Vanessa atalanta TaxID=42275 RepID=UPI001FCCE7D6|nr:nucleolar MIF4G domain-containing protein 1 [Vanessa atalanta]
MKKVKPNRPKFTNTRKVLRKEKRKQKKIHRKEHYLKKKNDPNVKTSAGKFVKRPVDNSEQKSDSKKSQPQKQPTAQEIMIRQLAKEKKETEKLKSLMDSQRKQIMVKANEEEDKMIKKLEKQLGLNKSKNKNNYFADDGLDYLLEICDRATSEQIVAAEKHLAEVERDSDFEEDLAVVTGKELPKGNDENKKNKSKHNDDNSEDEMETDDEMEVDEEVDEEDDDDDDNEFGLDDDQFEDDNSQAEDFNDENFSDDEDVSEHSESDNEKDNKKSKINKLDKKSSKIKIVSEKDINKVFSEDEVSHLSSDEDLDGVSDEDNKVDEVSRIDKTEKPDVWEDIYGRKRDKEGNIIKEEKGIYIPPHLRNKDSASDKQLAQLKRQIKSVLNKLAGTNLHWACTSIENLYSHNSRNSVNTALTELWLEATVSPASTPDRMVAEHAALVSVLHANVGSEIGAHFLEELSRKFDEMLETPQPVEDKRLDNLVSCLAHLYCFKIYHACLLYDILARLVSQLSEKSMECVLTALRSAGGLLRRDEPARLRAFIQDSQARLAHAHHAADKGSRVKFLVEVLLAVKNNNLNKIPNYDPTYVEHLIKACRSVVRRGNYITPLNIRLEDLLKAHERGKWWVIGSAWEGNRIQEAEPAAKPLPSTDQKLLELARQQRMNTDVRRSIFCVIMSAEDYMDAFEKLQHLGLKGQQEREVVHVLLACCLQEKTYNPYYGVLGEKLCSFDRKYQLSIQYTVWDKIKDLESLSKQAMTNLGQFLIHLIMEKGLPLSVLKIIQFSDLNKKSVRFMRQILLAIIMNADLQASLEVFHRISKSPKLHMFRESLRLFIQHFLIKNAGKKTTILSEEEMATLKERAVEVDKILTMHETKLRF